MTILLTLAFFILKLFFSLILFVLWLRVALRYFHLSPLHPVSALIRELTDPLLGSLDRMTATKAKSRFPSRYDINGLIGIGIVELLKFVALGFVVYHVFLPIQYLVVLMLGDFIVQPCNLLFYAVIIRVIMSWVNPDWPHPFAEILRIITEPFLAFFSRHVPPIAGFDFSPLILIFLLSVITIAVNAMMPLPLL